MKKRFLTFILTICLILPCIFMISACDDGITDCAYIQFVPAVDGQYVRYSSMMSSAETHIYLMENETVTDWESNALIKISFKRNFGVDHEVDEKDTLVVDIERLSTMYMIIKAEYYYNNLIDKVPKKVYLNGEDIMSYVNHDLSEAPKNHGTFYSSGTLYFENFGLIKGNQSKYINKIEYK